jgi:hypothetical protein
VRDADLALFLLLGQFAQKEVLKVGEIAPTLNLPLSPLVNLSELLPEEVKEAIHTSEVFKLLYVFESYLRDFVLDSLTESQKEAWWTRIPGHVRLEIEGLEKKDERKVWMAHSSRSKLDLATLPQLIAIMEEKSNWEDVFSNVLRDKSLLSETKTICHTRNLVCHMHVVSDEEIERLKLVIRDWFRVVAP